MAPPITAPRRHPPIKPNAARSCSPITTNPKILLVQRPRRLNCPASWLSTCWVSCSGLGVLDHRKAIAAWLGGAMSLALASCSYLPANGPQASTLVEAADTPDTAGFEVIDIDPPVIKALQSVPNRRFVGLFGGAAPSPILSIGVGDVVVVTRTASPCRLRRSISKA